MSNITLLGGETVQVTGAAPASVSNIASGETVRVTVQSIANLAGGGSPGGTSGQVQYNNAGSFGGLSNSALLALLPGVQAEALRIVTTAGAVTMTATDNIVEIAQSSQATITVNLPSSPTTGLVQTVKDGSFNNSSYVLTPASGNIDNQTTYTMNSNGASISYYWNGSNYRIV